MLWYKAWLETRARFLLGALLVSAVTAFFVLGHPFMIRQWRSDLLLHPDWSEPAWFPRALVDYPYFLWHFVYDEMLQNAWVVSAILLGLGGIDREAAMGTAGFTLSLPVRRRDLLAVRLAVGGGEAILLGFLPSLLLPLLSRVMGRAYPLPQALAHSALLVCGGMIFFALSVLLSTAVRDENTPLLIGVSLAAVLYFLMQPYADGLTPGPWWSRVLNLPRLLAGPAEIHAPGDLPWKGVALSVAVTIALLGASFRLSDLRDY
jgi:ABC-2 type transport system permease protein